MQETICHELLLTTDELDLKVEGSVLFFRNKFLNQFEWHNSGVVLHNPCLSTLKRIRESVLNELTV